MYIFDGINPNDMSRAFKSVTLEVYAGHRTFTAGVQIEAYRKDHYVLLHCDDEYFTNTGEREIEHEIYSLFEVDEFGEKVPVTSADPDYKKILSEIAESVRMEELEYD